MDTDVQEAATAEAIMRPTQPLTRLLYVLPNNMYSANRMRTLVRLFSTFDVATSNRCRAIELDAIIEENIKLIGSHKLTIDIVIGGIRRDLTR